MKCWIAALYNVYTRPLHDVTISYDKIEYTIHLMLVIIKKIFFSNF